MIKSDFPRWWPKSLAVSYALAISSVAVALIVAEFLTGLLNAEAIASLMLCAVILAPLIVALAISAQRTTAEELRRSSEALHAAMEDQRRIQTAFRRSETYLNEAQLLSRTGSFGWDVTSGEIVWSDQLYRIFGLEPTTRPAAKLILQRIHPDDRSSVREIIDRAVREGEGFDHEHRLLMPDGSVKYVHAVARAEKDISGSIEFVGTVTDVTAVKETERKLRRSQAYLAEAQRLSHTSSWAWDVRRREFLHRSAELYRLFELDPKNDTLPPQSFHNRILPEDRERVIEIAQRAVREKADLEADFRIALPDGSIRYVHSVGHPVLGSDGDVLELVGTHIDVTEQRLVNQRLQEAFDEIKKSEDRFRLVIDKIPTLVWRATPEGFPDFLNQRALDYIGITSEQVGISWPSAFHRDDRKDMVEKWNTIRESGMRGGFEARLRRHDGEYRWFLFEGEPLRDESGNIVKWYGSSTDIEDRKRAEEKLRRSEAKLIEAQRVTQTGSFVWNISTGKRIGSKEFFRILGFDDPRSVTFERMLQRAHPEDRALVEQAMHRASSSGKDIDYKHRLLMPDGSIKHVHVVAHIGRNQANELEYVGAVVDITAAKLAQEKFDKAQAELARVTRVTALGELTASIAHEVKQPIAATVTNAQSALHFLEAEVVDMSELREILRDIVKDGNRAAEVINRIRDLIKRTPPRRDRVEINETIREVIEFIRGEAAKNRVSLRVELANHLPHVWGDRVELQQVILNLVMNGIEAMQSVEDRPRELVIRSDRHEAQQARVSVIDYGVGLPAENADRLFAAFFTTKSNGMGMGLSICRSIIEAHNGRLWATANATHGATFQFVLPVSTEAALGNGPAPT